MKTALLVALLAGSLRAETLITPAPIDPYDALYITGFNPDYSLGPSIYSGTELWSVGSRAALLKRWPRRRRRTSLRGIGSSRFPRPYPNLLSPVRSQSPLSGFSHSMRSKEGGGDENQNRTQGSRNRTVRFLVQVGAGSAPGRSLARRPYATESRGDRAPRDRS